MRKKYGLLALVGAIGLAAAGCGSSNSNASGGGGGNGPNKASAPGVTASTVTVGLITSLTGPGASEFSHVAQGAQARIDAQNALGGVNGRQIKIMTKDDQTSPTGVVDAANLMIQQPVFAVMGQSPVLFAAARTLEQNGMPVIGGGFDGQEWGEQPYTNMFTYEGAGSTAVGTDPHAPQYTTGAQFIKDQGGTNVAAMGYAISPSSSNAAKGLAKAAKVVGIKAGLVDTSIPFGTVSVEPLALQMKQAGVNSAVLNMDENTNFAIITAAKQAGVDLKVAVSATGYGQTLLDDAAAVQAAQGGFFTSECDPVENHTPATEAMQAALAKYENFHGVPDFDWCEGYLGADLMIKGLELAGKNPTRQSFENGLRTVTDYTAGGLIANPANFSLSQFGKSPNTACEFYVKLQGTSFVPVPADGKPTCGTKIPHSDLAS